MNTDRCLDSQLKEDTQQIFLEAAEFVIKLVFEPTEQVYFKRKLLEGVEEVWGHGGFLKSTSKKADFEIRFSDTNLIEVVHREKRAKQFYLTFHRDCALRKVTAYYHTGMPALQMLLKEIFAILLKKDGFLLHGSSCLDKDGNLKMFLAQTGGGKTAVANLLSGEGDFIKVSDDIFIIRKVHNSWRFFSPPFVEKDTLPVKKKAKNIELFFIRKSKMAAKKEILDSNIILRLLLKQIWSETGRIDKSTLKNAMVFVKENKFYWLDSILNAKAIKKVLYED